MDESEAREQAVKRIKRKRQFQQQLVVFIVINLFVWGIWAAVGGGFPWPVFLTFGWGIGIVMQAWSVYGESPITDDEIRREMGKGKDAS
ncbi:MAG: 2TM domain-containing protein [Acidimicrobiia bacterium]